MSWSNWCKQQNETRQEWVDPLTFWWCGERLTWCRVYSLASCYFGFCSTAKSRRCRWMDENWPNGPHYSDWPGPGHPATHRLPHNFLPARTAASPHELPETSDTPDTFPFWSHIGKIKKIKRIICLSEHQSLVKQIRSHNNPLKSEGNLLTFLRLKALSSSFSTAWIFFTLMIQTASFPKMQDSWSGENMAAKDSKTHICFYLFSQLKSIKVFFQPKVIVFSHFLSSFNLQNSIFFLYNLHPVCMRTK